MRVRAQQGDTVEALVWRHLGRAAGAVEATFAANPGLADHGAVLPHGTPVEIPDTSPAPQKRLVQLWD